MKNKDLILQAKVIAIRWHLENLLANFNSANPKNKKLFIHIPKNAGMTIRRSDVLQNKIIVARPNIFKTSRYSQDLLTTMKITGDHHGFEHARWKDIHPRITNSHTSFAIIRNPWDRVVSRFFFAKLAIEVQNNGADSVILGCTEVGMLLNKENVTLPVYDTVEIHCNDIFNSIIL